MDDRESRVSVPNGRGGGFARGEGAVGESADVHAWASNMEQSRRETA